MSHFSKNADLPNNPMLIYRDVFEWMISIRSCCKKVKLFIGAPW